MEPFAQHFFTEIFGINTHFIRFGKGHRKLVFLHGWGGSAESFWDLVSKLQKSLKNTEFILLDLPGFGQTQFPPKTGWGSVDYADFLAEFLQKVLKTKTPKTDFYVHSFGGRVVVRLCQKYPKMVGKIIFTASAGIKWPPSFRQKISLWLAKNAVLFRNKIPQKFQKWVMTKIFGARDWGIVDDCLKSTLRKVLEEPDFREELPKIKNKTLVLWGARDSITPIKSGNVFAKKLPYNEFHVFQTGRHGIHHTHAEEITQKVVKFLETGANQI